MYNNISSHVFQRQSFDQHGFTSDIRIEDALLCTEIVIDNNQTCKLLPWMLRMDMHKVFDTIDHPHTHTRTVSQTQWEQATKAKEYNKKHSCQ